MEKAHGQRLKKKIYDTPLWEVTGNGLKDTSYLFGSLHILSEDWLNDYPTITEVLQRSDIYIGERNLFEYLQQNTASVNNQEPLINALTKAQYEYIDSFLRVNYEGASLHDSDAVNFTIIDLLGLTGEYLIKKSGGKRANLDASIQKKALVLKKEIIGLETEAALNTLYLKGRSVSEVADVIINVIKKAETPVLQAELLKLKEAYINLKIDYQFTKQSGNENTIEKRNLLWLPKVITAMQKAGCFIHVGLGHLEYKQGLIMLLIKKGYQVKPIAVK